MKCLHQNLDVWVQLATVNVLKEKNKDSTYHRFDPVIKNIEPMGELDET